MNFASGRRRRHADINLTPLIDLFLNILVFFMVTTTFATESLFYVDLPEATKGDTITEKKLITIDLARDGRIALDGKQLTITSLTAALKEIPEAKRAKIPIVVRADQGTRHGRVVEVLDVIRNIGMRNVGIATDTKRLLKQ